MKTKSADVADGWLSQPLGTSPPDISASIEEVVNWVWAHVVNPDTVQTHSYALGLVVRSPLPVHMSDIRPHRPRNTMPAAHFGAVHFGGAASSFSKATSAKAGQVAMVSSVGWFHQIRNLDRIFF